MHRGVPTTSEGDRSGVLRTDKQASGKGTMAPTGGREDTKADEEKGKEVDGISIMDESQDKKVGVGAGGGGDTGGERSTGRGGRKRTGNRRGAQEKVGRKRRETTMRWGAATAGTRGRLGTGSRRSTTDIRGMTGTRSLRGST